MFVIKNYEFWVNKEKNIINIRENRAYNTKKKAIWKRICLKMC